jgi:hypothetical protein
MITERSRRTITILSAIPLVFILSALFMIALLPSPRSHVDYMIAGTCATLVSLIAAFALLGGLSAIPNVRRRD